MTEILVELPISKSERLSVVMTPARPQGEYVIEMSHELREHIFKHDELTEHMLVAIGIDEQDAHRVVQHMVECSRSTTSVICSTSNTPLPRPESANCVYVKDLSLTQCRTMLYQVSNVAEEKDSIQTCPPQEDPLTLSSLISPINPTMCLGTPDPPLPPLHNMPPTLLPHPRRLRHRDYKNNAQNISNGFVFPSRAFKFDPQETPCHHHAGKMNEHLARHSIIRCGEDFGVVTKLKEEYLILKVYDRTNKQFNGDVRKTLPLQKGKWSLLQTTTAAHKTIMAAFTQLEADRKKINSDADVNVEDEEEEETPPPVKKKQKKTHTPKIPLNPKTVEPFYNETHTPKFSLNPKKVVPFNVAIKKKTLVVPFDNDDEEDDVPYLDDESEDADPTYKVIDKELDESENEEPQAQPPPPVAPNAVMPLLPPPRVIQIEYDAYEQGISHEHFMEFQRQPKDYTEKHVGSTMSGVTLRVRRHTGKQEEVRAMCCLYKSVNPYCKAKSYMDDVKLYRSPPAEYVHLSQLSSTELRDIPFKDALFELRCKAICSQCRTSGAVALGKHEADDFLNISKHTEVCQMCKRKTIIKDQLGGKVCNPCASVSMEEKVVRAVKVLERVFPNFQIKVKHDKQSTSVQVSATVHKYPDIVVFGVVNGIQVLYVIEVNERRHQDYDDKADAKKMLEQTVKWTYDLLPHNAKSNITNPNIRVVMIHFNPDTNYTVTTEEGVEVVDRDLVYRILVLRQSMIWHMLHVNEVRHVLNWYMFYTNDPKTNHKYLLYGDPGFAFVNCGPRVPIRSEIDKMKWKYALDPMEGSQINKYNIERLTAPVLYGRYEMPGSVIPTTFKNAFFKHVEAFNIMKMTRK